MYPTVGQNARGCGYGFWSANETRSHGFATTPSWASSPEGAKRQQEATMETKRVTRLLAEELRSRRAGGEAILTLDVRTPDARVVHPYEIPGSRWMPLAEVVQHSAALPRDTTIVAYCT